MTDRGTILAVDDMHDSLRMLVETLQGEGYRVRPADSGFLALAAASAIPPDLILLDVRMPDMDGFQVLEKLKADEQTRNIPVIFLSGMADSADRVEGLRLGAVDFISKPFQREELLARVATHLELGRLRRRLEVLLEEQHTRMLQEISGAEARYREIFEGALEGIYRADVQGRILVCNPAFARILGFRSPQEVIGTLTSSLQERWVTPELHSGFLHQLEEKGMVRGFECELYRKDGTRIWVTVNARAIREDNGQIGYVEGFLGDITERKLAREALKKSEAQYKHLSQEFNTVLEAIPDSLSLVSHDFKVLWANRRAVETMVEGVEKVQGELCHKLWFDRATPCESCQGSKTVATGAISEFVIAQDARTWEIRLIPIKDESDKVISFVRLGRDITEMRALEGQLREAQKLEAIGTLAGGIAHDFNNILAPIIGYTEMAMDGIPGSAPLRRYLEQVLGAACRARDLVWQILAFSRRGQQTAMTGMDISMIVKEALKLLRATLPSSIQIRQHLEKGVALVDATQIHQVIINLCTNAAHAMEGKGLLEVSLVQVHLEKQDPVSGHMPLKLPSGPYLKLSVSDTGHGMDEETMRRIFEPYFTTKEVGKGTGLGLAVVHGIVTRHGGEIAVRSEPGKGTVFHVYFPMLVEKAAESIIHLDSLPRGKERVLLVDDEQPIVNMATTILEGLGYRVTSLTRSRDALSLFRARPEAYDLVVTDFTMPEMTGIELAREMLQLRPDLPVVLCSGTSEESLESRALEIGIAGFAVKPLDRRRLAELVRNALDGK